MCTNDMPFVQFDMLIRNMEVHGREGITSFIQDVDLFPYCIVGTF